MTWHASAAVSQAALSRPRLAAPQSLALRAPFPPLRAVVPSQSSSTVVMAAMSARLALPGAAAGVGYSAGHPRSVGAPGQSLRLAMPRRVCASASQHGDGHAHVCELCGVSARSAAHLQQHVNGRRHKQAVRRAEVPEFASQAEASLNSLEAMNEWLKRLGHDEAESKSAARRELREIHINIYDLVEDRLEPIFDTVPELRRYSLKQGKIFPRKEAKQSDSELRVFLRRFGSS